MNDLATAPDGRLVAAGFGEGSVIWTPRPSATAEDLAAELERRDPACLDEQQRVAYLGEPVRQASERARAAR